MLVVLVVVVVVGGGGAGAEALTVVSQDAQTAPVANPWGQLLPC